MSKGSRPRPYSVSQSTFGNNWDAIFRKKEETMQVRADQIKEGGVPCGCGRSPTGFCIGWHGLSDEEFQRRLTEHQNKQQTQGE
jgi:hypothetical protein